MPTEPQLSRKCSTFFWNPEVYYCFHNGTPSSPTNILYAFFPVLCIEYCNYITKYIYMSLIILYVP